MQYPVIYVVFFAFLIALAVIVLAWLTQREERKSEDRRYTSFSDLPVNPVKRTLEL